MVDNEEPQATQIANNQIASEGHKLPEQSRVPECDIPRPFGFEHLIHQWQPMGIRVTLNLPFTGNDQDYIFAIRNGPFIPTLFYQYFDTSAEASFDVNGVLDPKTRKLGANDTYESYAFNNMRAVLHAGPNYKQIKPDSSAVYITQFDQPPILSSISTMFRRWRGTMHYRVRTVAGFTTQGYIFSSLVRNSPGIIGLYPTQNYVAGVSREDSSYRESMINSYVMGDTAMFRHFEVQVPFEYPVPYYDQYNWIGNRSRPADKFMYGRKTDVISSVSRLRNINNEPHGDNFVLIGLRGKLESSVQNSQITFELEYRAGDDFQFSDPFLPFNKHYLIPQSTYLKIVPNVIQVPGTTYVSDGLHGFKPMTSPAESLVRDLHGAIDATSNVFSASIKDPITLKPVVTNFGPRRVHRLGKREVGDESVDEVDDLSSEAGDSPDVLEFKRNLRKSLNL